MNTDKTVISEMPSAFNPELIVTKEMWAVSLVRTTTIPRLDCSAATICGHQHANIFVQYCQDGEIIMTRLHAKPYKKADGEEKDPRYNANYLDIEIKDNKKIQINIIDQNTLHLAVKSLLWKKDVFEYFKDLDLLQHTANKTWLISAQSALNVMEDIKKQEHEFNTISRTRFWGLGNRSITLKAANSLITELNNGLIMKIASLPTLGIIAVVSKSLILPAIAFIPFAPTVVGATIAITSIKAIKDAAEDVYNESSRPKFSTIVGAHSCFTWAREKLLLLDHEEINKFLAPKEFDKFIAMTSNYL